MNPVTTGPIGIRILLTPPYSELHSGKKKGLKLSQNQPYSYE
jgi:hypothetical protein